MKEEICVSVIVPVYQVEAYLERCLESVVGQTYWDLQIILVEDGSVDRCGEICDRWQQRDGRIRVVHQKNAGLGYSRNVGLEQARGKYVCFVDGDDHIHRELVEKLVSFGERTGADACYFGCVDVVDGVASVKQPPQKLLYQGEAVRREFGARLLGRLPWEQDILYCGMSACHAFYRREFLEKHGLRFGSERTQFISEDLMFNLAVCSCAGTIAVLPEDLYFYEIRRAGSLRSTYREDRFEKCLRMWEALAALSEQWQLGEEGRLRSDRYLIGALIGCVKREVRSGKSAGDVRKAIDIWLRNETVTELLERYPVWKLPIRQRLFCCCARRRWKSGVFLLAWLQNIRAGNVI